MLYTSFKLIPSHTSQSRVADLLKVHTHSHSFRQATTSRQSQALPCSSSSLRGVICEGPAPPLAPLRLGGVSLFFFLSELSYQTKLLPPSTDPNSHSALSPPPSPPFSRAFPAQPRILCAESFCLGASYTNDSNWPGAKRRFKSESELPFAKRRKETKRPNLSEVVTCLRNFRYS